MLRLRSEGLAWREIDGEVVLVDLVVATYLSTNETAAVLWRRLADGTSEDELVRALVAAYDVDAETAAADVRAFLDDCRARALLDEKS